MGSIQQSLEKKLQAAQTRLREGKVGVSIQARGHRLYLRATLPPKPGSGKQHWHQQTISLGIYANSVGIEVAEAQAKKIGGLIALGQFDWQPYIRRNSFITAQTIGDWLEKYEKDYFTRHGDTPKSRSSLNKNDWIYLKRLPVDEPLTEQCLLKAINDTTANTANRLKTCNALQRLVKFSEFQTNINFKNLAGKSEPKERDLPNDEEILEWYDRIDDPKHRAAYALIAICGFRPHEIFHLDLSSLQQGSDYIKVLNDTKTGTRYAFPLYPEWVDEFNLREIELPEVNTKEKSNADLGGTIAPMFRRYQIPFSPYDLRHCWARRSVDCGMDPRKAADSLGHSLTTHYKRYNKWFKEKDSQRAFDLLKQNPYRRQAPKRPPQPNSEV
jgi:integrase